MNTYSLWSMFPNLQGKLQYATNDLFLYRSEMILILLIIIITENAIFPFGKVLAKLTKIVNYMLQLLMVLMVKPTSQTTGVIIFMAY